MTHSNNQWILTLSCEDKAGIVADVAGLFRDKGFNIRESSQFEDLFSKHFFMRTEFDYLGGDSLVDEDELRRTFGRVADQYGMSWSLVNKAWRPKVVIAVSKWGHCLNTLLNSWRSGSLPVDVVAVVSNHRDMESLAVWHKLPYHHLPVTGDNKASQEQALRQLLSDYQCDLLVLARYMQILSDDFCGELVGKAINIHHSFLPGFKGAKPYHQAYERGVKLIGATAHYVTADLDEGPIIEQAVERVSHVNLPEEMVEKGRDIEAVVLQRAVRWHAEHRVLLNGNKTVVFNR